MTDFDAIMDRKAAAAIGVVETVLAGPPRDILVVGCGSGIEAGVLARHFGVRTVGIDLGGQFEFEDEASAPATLMHMDARDLRFADASFDLVYSFHALEHIPGPERALAEMARVLRPGGTYFIGTPNKSRLVGYLGSAAAVREKLQWNLADLGKRITGRWSNEAGAHAGFTANELIGLCRAAFRDSHDVTESYYLRQYGQLASWMDLLTRTGVSSLILPCVYVAGRNVPNP